MDVIIRIAAGILLVLALLAAGCSVLLSGATSDAGRREPAVLRTRQEGSVDEALRVVLGLD